MNSNELIAHSSWLIAGDPVAGLARPPEADKPMAGSGLRVWPSWFRGSEFKGGEDE